MQNILNKNPNTHTAPISNIQTSTKDEILQVNWADRPAEELLFSLKQKILSKPWMSPHHKKWMTDKVEVLFQNKDQIWLEKLDKGIEFNNQKLILNTPEGQLKFASHQAGYEEVKNIPWLEKNRNIRTRNPEAKGKEWLYANRSAIEKMKEAGKKICTEKQLLAAANIFPWDSECTADKCSTKVKDFFDLLGVEQYGSYSPYTIDDQPAGWRSNHHRFLWSSTDKSYLWCREKGKDENGIEYPESGKLLNYHKDCALGVWFLEE